MLLLKFKWKRKKYLKQQSVEGDRGKKRDRAKGTDPF